MMVMVARFTEEGLIITGVECDIIDVLIEFGWTAVSHNIIVILMGMLNLNLF
jgi:hypothetical protein